MRFLQIELLEAPDGLPVTVDEFIDHARLNGLTVDRQPELLQRELHAATIRAERYLRRSLLTQKLAGLYLPEPADSASARLIVLPRGRVQSVESIVSAGAMIDAAGYAFDGWNMITLGAPIGAAAVATWLSGYGDQPEDVPDLIREGIYEYATVLYENRTGGRETKYQAEAGATIPPGIRDVWRPFQIEVSG